MNKDQIGRVLSSGFLPSQVGALARYVEPISVWEPLDTVRASLAADPSVQCIPVEAEQGIAGPQGLMRNGGISGPQGLITNGGSKYLRDL